LGWRGALDGLNSAQIAALAPRPGEVGIVTKLLDGSSVLLSHELVLPLMQAKADALVEHDGAELVVILCGADWSELRSLRLIVNPGKLFPAMIGALAQGRKLGVIKRVRYAGLGIEAVVTAASPYAGDGRLELARRAGAELREAGCELVWMTCVGMDAPMRTIVAEETGVPVILAHALLARVVTELLETEAGVPALA
jgi:protein AroM